MKRTYIIASLVLAVVSSACQHDLEHNMVPDKLGLSSTEVLQEPSVLTGRTTVSIIKSGKGTSSADVQLVPCTQEEIDAWREAEEYETPITLAKESKYNLEDNTFHFEESDIRKTTTVTWDTDFFAKSAINGTDYAIAFKLVEGSIDTDPLRSMVIIKPLLTSVTFRNKDLKTLFPGENDQETVNEFEGEINIDYPISTQDITITLAVDNSLIAAEAENRGKEFEPAPEGFMTLASDKVVIPAGKTIAQFNYTLDYSALYDENGEFLKRPVNYMIPVTIKEKDPVLLGNGETMVSCIIVNIANDGVITPPSDPIELIHGPWEVLEGADQHIGKDPKCSAPDWFGNYNANKLTDWNFYTNNNDASINGFWGSWFWTEPVFPIVFVFDAIDTYIFGEWYKMDGPTFQGQFREFEIYVAQEYNAADTNWKLAAKGRTGFHGNKQFPYGDGTDKEKLKQCTYLIPEDAEAEGSEFNYTLGRYVKLVIVKTEDIYPTQSKGGYLSEFFARGWKQ